MWFKEKPIEEKILAYRKEVEEFIDNEFARLRKEEQMWQERKMDMILHEIKARGWRVIINP